MIIEDERLENLADSSTTSRGTAEDVDTDGDERRNEPAPSIIGKAIRRGRGAGNSAITVRTLLVSTLLIALIAGLGVLGWMVNSKSDEVDQLNVRAADGAHAEQVALDYAVGAADMNFQDVSGWRGRLTKGTGPELSNKLSQAASSMDQIITPLQWVSTSTPIAAKVRSVTNGIFVVDCFVSVMTKNTQAPEGIQSTATYSLTIDSGHDWVITDVGGIDSALAPK